MKTDIKESGFIPLVLRKDEHNDHIILFKISQTAYLKTDKDQIPRVITGISLRPHNSVTYALAHGSQETWHYDFEMSLERDIILATTN